MHKRSRNDGDILAALSADQPVQGFLQCIRSTGSGQGDISLRRQRCLVAQELYRTPNTHTPFGVVCSSTEVPGNKKPLAIYHTNPQALLHLAITRSVRYYEFLLYCRARAPSNILRLAIYLDQTTPGNNNRPDLARCSQCIYYTCLDYPSWYIARRTGWHAYAYVLAKDQKRSELTDTRLVRFVLRTFLNRDVSDPDFGFVLTTKHNGKTEVFRFKMSVQIADWPQHAKTFNLNGHQGRIPCWICYNCLGRCSYFEDPELVHVSSPDYAKLKRHTKDTFRIVVDRLENAANAGAVGELRALETNLGVKYDEHALLWDREVRHMLEPPDAIYVDWMHTVASSGGFGQYGVNDYVLSLVEKSHIELPDIDNWCANVKYPKGFTKLTRHLFEERVRPTRGCFIRAFASEVLAVITFGFPLIL